MNNTEIQLYKIRLQALKNGLKIVILSKYNI